MKTFHCERCQARLFFENSSCESCGAAVAFQPSTNSFRAVDVDEAGGIVAQETANPVVFCSNRLHPAACNWVVEDGQPLCLSCRTTKVLPNLADPANCENVRKIETAKRRLVYSLNAWGLPFPSKDEDAEHGVEFHFLEQLDPQQKVLTGHDNGVITLNVAEADDSTRERVRAEMHESYRTLLGHLRHEVGHYYWDRLIANTPWQDEFRTLFGDEQADYGEALQKHYKEPVADWASRFVSSYASSHPWEDWAECWAHYMHLRDAMETAASWGLRLDNAVPGLEPVVTAPLPEHGSARQAIVEHWLPTSQFINAMSRSLGTHDSYPFVVPDPVLEKLEFIHRVVHAGVSGQFAMNFQAAETAEPASDAA